MFVFAPPRRVLLNWLLLATSWLLATTIVQAAEPSASQRAAFKQAYAAAQQGGNGWQSLAAGLRDYPLYPYLQEAALEHDIQQIDRAYERFKQLCDLKKEVFDEDLLAIVEDEVLEATPEFPAAVLEPIRKGAALSNPLTHAVGRAAKCSPCL